MRLDTDDCRSRFAAARHAYLATADADGVPHVVPVTFALISAVGGAALSTGAGAPAADEVVVAVDHKPKTTRDLKRLRNIAENPHVSFLVDRYDDDWAHLWWVRADGDAVVEHDDKPDGAPRAAALDALAARYPQYQERRPDGPLIRVRVTRWSGWSHG
ncbi:TIGR03668 family PPOX class F420-dependent oxidoreductase [Promicromonospora sp. Populi]|uniref:TIGR03668 family PPOX class F420-dependent oxidoreductase n=1 Tax=Promicromonospora sp. Populi TaxID=3239420 RepID=UPI0034E27752